MASLVWSFRVELFLIITCCFLVIMLVISVFSVKESHLFFRKSAALNNFLSIIGQLGANDGFCMISLASTIFFNHFPTIFVEKN